LKLLRGEAGRHDLMKIIATGLSYKTAPVEVRERVAVPAGRLPCVGCRLKVAAGLTEAVVVSTCNRVEVYGVAETGRWRPEVLFADPAAAETLYHHEDADAVRHLLSVTSGMDSMVVGETEINGQIKQAYQAAQQAKLTGRVTNRLFQKAFETAKDIRTRTSIGRGAASVGSVAVELAEKVFGGDLSQQTVLIVGAGKMGEACVRHLLKKGAAQVIVANRSLEKAAALAKEFGGRAVALDELVAAVAEADIVVSSTGSPQTVLDRSQVAAAMSGRRSRPLVLIDIAVPRDIGRDVASLPNVFLHDIDDLQAIVRENLRHREQELSLCRELLETHTAEVLARLTPRRVPARPAAMPAWEPALVPAT
jgi:glutamyl-tRNA reductase